MSDRGSSALWARVRGAWPWLLLVVALGLWVVENRDNRGGLDEGMAAPGLVLASEHGDFVLDEQRGHVVVLAFWASWCGACRAEAPHLSRLADQIADAGDQVVGVSVDAFTLDEIRDHANRFGIRYRVARAAPEDLDRYAVEVLPTIYVIDPAGRITASFTGVVHTDAVLEEVERARTGASALASR